MEVDETLIKERVEYIKINVDFKEVMRIIEKLLKEF
jgi:hypothetical protein